MTAAVLGTNASPSQRGLVLAILAVVGCGRLGYDDSLCLVEVIAPPFWTTSQEFVAVPGAELHFRPASADESWLVVISAKVSSELFDEDLSRVQTRYLLNGVEWGVGGTFTDDATTAGSWQHFFVVSESTDEQVVRLEIRDPNAVEASITDARIIALRLPDGAVAHYASVDQRMTVTASDYSDFLTTNFMPPASGDYLFLVGAAAAELDDPSAGSALRVSGSLGADWPVQENQRKARETALFARRKTLATSPVDIKVQSLCAVDACEILYPRVLALQLDAFASSESDDNSEDIAFSAPAQLQVNEVAADSRTYLAVATTWIDGQCPEGSALRRIEWSTPQKTLFEIVHQHDNCGFQTSYGWFGIVRAQSPTVIRTNVSSDNSILLQMMESNLHLVELER